MANEEHVAILKSGVEAWNKPGTRALTTHVAELAQSNPARLEQLRSGLASQLIDQLRGTKLNRGVAADIVNAARSMSVVRDGIASTFYHPFLGVERLNQVVTGIQELGYTFVSARDVLPDSS